jgi:hypothetical protein
MRSDGFKFPVTVKKWKRRAVLAKCHLGDMEYLMRPVHVRRSSLDQQPALLKRVCHLVRCVGWRDLVRQVLLGLKGLDHLIEHRLEHPGMFEPGLVAGEVDAAVDRNPVRPVLDRQVTDPERLGFVRERRDGLLHDGVLIA